MKTSFFILAYLIAMVVCGGAKSTEIQRDALNPVAVDELPSIQEVLPYLISGMSRDEVLSILGETTFRYAAAFGGVSGGPASSHYTNYQLRQGANLVLRFDYTKTPPSFVSATQAGSAWPSDEK